LNENNNYVDKYGTDWLFQHRADLRGEFLRLATEDTGVSGIPGRPAEVLWDEKIIDIDPEEGQITLASGEQVKADLVIGKLFKHGLIDRLTDDVRQLRMASSLW